MQSGRSCSSTGENTVIEALLLLLGLLCMAVVARVAALDLALALALPESSAACVAGHFYSLDEDSSLPTMPHAQEFLYRCVANLRKAFVSSLTPSHCRALS